MDFKPLPVLESVPASFVPHGDATHVYEILSLLSGYAAVHQLETRHEQKQYDLLGTHVPRVCVDSKRLTRQIQTMLSPQVLRLFLGFYCRVAIFALLLHHSQDPFTLHLDERRPVGQRSRRLVATSVSMPDGEPANAIPCGPYIMKKFGYSCTIMPRLVAIPSCQ